MIKSLGGEAGSETTSKRLAISSRSVTGQSASSKIE